MIGNSHKLCNIFMLYKLDGVMFRVLPLKLDLLKSKPQFLHINPIIDSIFVTIWSACQDK